MILKQLCRLLVIGTLTIAGFAITACTGSEAPDAAEVSPALAAIESAAPIGH